MPVEQVRRLVDEDSGLGDEILRAYLVRRSLAIGLGVGFRIIGSRFSADTARLRDFASRNRLPHRCIDLETDVEAERTLRQLRIGPRDTPLVVWRHHLLRNPSNAELAAMIGLPAPADDAPSTCDLLVVGAGPAGLAAGVYGASEGLRTVVLDAVAAGGQAATSSRIENYLGFPAGISGGELAERAVIQADKFGAHTRIPASAIGLERDDGQYTVRLDGGGLATARTVIVATGARYRKLPVPRLEEFEESSVFYAATPLEAQLCVDDPVVVVGGGNSAGQAALFLADHARTVRMVVREHTLDEFMSSYLADRILTDGRIEVLVHTEVRELVGERGVLEAVVVEDTASGERQRVEARELMVFIGAEPCTGWLTGRRRPRLRWVRAHRSLGGRARCRGVLRDRPRPAAAGDQRARGLRRRGRAQRVGRAGRLGGRRGRHGGPAGARAPQQPHGDLIPRVEGRLPISASRNAAAQHERGSD